MLNGMRTGEPRGWSAASSFPVLYTVTSLRLDASEGRRRKKGSKTLIPISTVKISKLTKPKTKKGKGGDEGAGEGEEMKNLYPKGKGKIHPSPAAAPPPPSSAHDALAVLKLLPAAILVLAAAMGYEDKEVLAYLITRSIHDHGAAAGPTVGAERRRSRGPAEHRPTFDCGCFDCYTRFWSRWDGSPDREVIHQAIEAFEEHLASSERKGVRGRRKDRRGVEKAEKGKEKKAEEARKPAEAPAQSPVPPAELEKKPLEEPAGGKAAEARGAADTASAAEDEGSGGGEEDAETAAGGERRKGWSDVMGFVNSRFWSLWGPGV